MIVKYFNEGEWILIDHVDSVVQKEIIIATLAEWYDKEVKAGQLPVSRKDYNDSTSETIDKAFMALDAFPTSLGTAYYNILAINSESIKEGSCVELVSFKRDESKGNCVINILTNQPCYALNDCGQTVEKIR
jgi:hypothetical protein